MKSKLIILSTFAIAAVAAYVFLQSGLPAQAQKTDEVEAFEMRDDAPFEFNGTVWSSHEDFLENGRCGTPKLTEAEMAEIERQVAVAKENRKAANGGYELDVSGGVINV